MLVRRGDDVLTGLRPLNPENLLQPSALRVVPTLTQLPLTHLLSRRLLLEHLHEFHVQLVAALLNFLLGLAQSVGRLTTLAPVKVALSHLLRAAFLVSVGPGHLVDRARELLLNRLPLIHETAVPRADLVSVRALTAQGLLAEGGLLVCCELAGSGSFLDSGPALHLDRARAWRLRLERFRWRHGRGNIAAS